MKNFKYPVLIISALSLLLGLSIGQLQKQHQQIQQLKKEKAALSSLRFQFLKKTQHETESKLSKHKRTIEEALRHHLETGRAERTLEQQNLELEKCAHLKF